MENRFSFRLLIYTVLICCSLSASGQQRAIIVEIARKEIGTKEEYTNGGKRVNQYLKTVGLGGGYYWCAAFIKWCFNEAKIKTPFPPNGAARSWFPANRNIPVDEARPGDLIAFYYGNLGRIGHIAMIEKVHADGGLITIEGNTSSGLSRNGDGVHRLRRMKRSVYRASNWIDKK